MSDAGWEAHAARCKEVEELKILLATSQRDIAMLKEIIEVHSNMSKIQMQRIEDLTNELTNYQLIVTRRG